MQSISEKTQDGAGYVSMLEVLFKNMTLLHAENVSEKEPRS